MSHPCNSRGCQRLTRISLSLFRAHTHTRTQRQRDATPCAFQDPPRITFFLLHFEDRGGRVVLSSLSVHAAAGCRCACAEEVRTKWEPALLLLLLLLLLFLLLDLLQLQRRLSGLCCGSPPSKPREPAPLLAGSSQATATAAHASVARLGRHVGVGSVDGAVQLQHAALLEWRPAAPVPEVTFRIVRVVSLRRELVCYFVGLCE